jgi:hypothetical protein
MASWSSPTSHRGSSCYDLVIRGYLDDEGLD